MDGQSLSCESSTLKKNRPETKAKARQPQPVCQRKDAETQRAIASLEPLVLRVFLCVLCHSALNILGYRAEERWPEAAHYAKEQPLGQFEGSTNTRE